MDNVDGGAGTDILADTDFSAVTSDLSINNGATLQTLSNGYKITAIEQFANLTTGAGNDTLNFSGSYDDSVNTGSGNDTINLGLGVDNVDGGLGNDLLIVNYSTNTYSGSTSYVAGIQNSLSYQGSGAWSGNLFAYNNASGTYDQISFSRIERFQLTGTDYNDALSAGSGNDSLDGGSGNDRLESGGGNDILTGGSGTDTLIGGKGNDLYINPTGDTILENANEGVDTVESSVTFSLVAIDNVENLTLTGTTAINGTGNALNNLLTGNSANNSLTGNAGDDTLNGGGGTDTLVGGTGNDTYIVDTTTDVITEAASAGTDTVQSSVTFTLAALTNVENLTLTGTNAVNGTGNGLANIIIGNTNNNVLQGAAGNDQLFGNAGNDTLQGTNGGAGEYDYLNGGAGSDKFILGDSTWIGYDDGLTTNAGTNDYAEIADFNTAEDAIQLQGGLNYLLSVVGADTQLFIDKPNLEPDELIGIIKNQTGLSLTSPYFVYNPSLSLSVTPATVTEDGTANLIYTFTRTGATANPLTVNYTIGGTAINGTDYAIIGTSITFNPGSSTATLSIDPTIDAVIESDETVALTLLPVMEHTILTTTTVTGTITNDDNNTTIESFGNISLVKDGANKLFTQVGSNAAVALNRNGIQLYEGYAGWSFLAAETVNSSNQVLVKNSSLGVRIWSFDSNWNYVSVRGVATDQIAAQETVFGVDADGDSIIGNNPYTTLESAGNTSLIKDGDNKLFTKMGSNTAIALMRSGTQLFEGYSGWSFLAAETINGSNQALVKNSSLGLRIWRFDSNWNWTSVQGIATAQIPTQETVFGIDANGDGSIGNPNSLTLTGTSGNDTLIGGANSDVLTGLGGKDSLTGGLGSDRFGYQVLTDSFLANPDLITDFNATEDLLLVNSAGSISLVQ
jgi:Ca2+-binding RTX toxin-like protein